MSVSFGCFDIKGSVQQYVEAKFIFRVSHRFGPNFDIVFLIFSDDISKKDLVCNKNDVKNSFQNQSEKKNFLWGTREKNFLQEKRKLSFLWSLKCCCFSFGPQKQVFFASGYQREKMCSGVKKFLNPFCFACTLGLLPCLCRCKKC